MGQGFTDIKNTLAGVCILSGSAAIYLFTIFAVINFAAQAWPLTIAFMQRLWRVLRWIAITSWHWSATVPWDVLFGLGWLGMVQINEYAFGLACLAFLCFGLLSRLLHAESESSFRTVGGSLGIAVLFIVLGIMTVANKGEKPWSPTANLIDSRLAERVHLLPLAASLSPSLPKITIERTSSTEWAAVQHAIEEQRRSGISRVTARPTETRASKIDLTLRFVSPEQPLLIVVNNSDTTVSGGKWQVVLWNASKPGDIQPLRIPTTGIDWIRAHEESAREGVFDGVSSSLTQGDRLYGCAIVDCPDCAQGHTYAVSIVWGVGGWFSELKISKPGKLWVPGAYTREGMTAYFSTIESVPNSARIQIGDIR